MSNGFLILDLGTKVLTQVATSAWNGMGPGAVVLNGNAAFIANQMTASVTVADLISGTVVKTFPVDPGPVSLAVNPANNQLLALAEGTGTLDVVDLGSYAILSRIDAGSTERQGDFTMPLSSSITPNSSSPGGSFTLTITGSGFQSVQNLEFYVTGASSNGGMMSGGMGNMGQEDSNIKVSNLQVNPAGTQITASIQVLLAATVGTRQIRLETNYGEVMGMMANSLFTVTK
jgi:DNA-binding beta-propeller fold protein YncE